MTQKEKIGIGIITCNRPDFFKRTVSTLPAADVIIVVNDGIPYPKDIYPTGITKIEQHKSNLGVGRSKNDALRFLISNGCKHLFLCEDDIRIIDQGIIDKYIHASGITGIQHFNFAYHGPRNRTKDGVPVARKIVEYEGGVRIGLNKYLTGAFSYYKRNILDACGLMDPLYKNMWEHVDHTNKIIRNGFHPPYWWFADLADSYRYFEDLDPDLSRTTIIHDKWHSSVSTRLKNFYFFLRNGSYPWNIPDVEESVVESVLEKIRLDYSLK